MNAIIKKDIPFKLFANCKLTKGYSRSVINDLGRNIAQLIPNELYEILANFQERTVNEVLNEYEDVYSKTILNYFSFLFDQEFIFFSNDLSRFPDLTCNWYYPTEISNCIIDYDSNSKFDLLMAIMKFDSICCQHLQLRFYSGLIFSELITIVNEIQFYCSNILSLNIIFPFNEELNVEEIKKNFNLYDKVKLITFFNANKDETFEMGNKENNKRYIIFKNQTIFNEHNCGIINTDLFVINMKNYTEGLKYNTCLNRKISVDKDGLIKNCPSMSQSFGEIGTSDLLSIISLEQFKSKWYIDKRQIDICKDCEFKDICTDCRAYLEDPNNMFSKPLKCGYDPYLNKWEEWSVNPLKKNAMEFYSKD